MWFGELFQIGVYKRSQGRITRQVTFATLAIAFALAAWRVYVFRATAGPWFQKALSWVGVSITNQLGSGFVYGLSVAVLMIGLWISYRVVNIPRFADFLIAVEAEINKVSWPSRPELVRSAIVVILVIFVLSTILFGFDLVWGWLFEWLGILKSAN
jgi:preprotein translocase subunit SecE